MNELTDLPPSCQNETDLLRAARTGWWTEELRRHLANCEVCAEALLLHEVLGGLAATELQRPVGDASAIYRRAARAARQAAVRRATRAIVFWQRLATGVSAALAAVVAGWLWPAGSGLAARFGALVPALPQAGGIDGSPFLVIGSTILFVAATGLYLAWAEE